MEELYEYKRIGFKLKVYPGRISIEDRTGKTGLFVPDKIDILIENIAGVNIKGLSRKLQITMNDGTFRDIPIFAPHSEKVRQIILDLKDHRTPSAISGQTESSPTQEDPSQALKKLKELLVAELITQEEYDAKKAEILSRM